MAKRVRSWGPGRRNEGEVENELNPDQYWASINRGERAWAEGQDETGTTLEQRQLEATTVRIIFLVGVTAGVAVGIVLGVLFS